jgi:uncharacterized protein YkwD
MRSWLRQLPMGLLIAAAPPAPGTAPLEQRVLEELNRIRGAPDVLAEELRAFRSWYRGELIHIPGRLSPVITKEGAPAVDEAIAYVAARVPLPPLRFSPLLTRAAADHAAYLAQGPVGHYGADGSNPADRVARRGGGRNVGEIISFGYDDAAGVVRQFVVDDGVPDRGHRDIVFSARYLFAGTACAPHPRYRILCVVVLAPTADGRVRSPPPPSARRRRASGG